MPLVTIPCKARERLLENARELRQAKLDENWSYVDWLEAWSGGFFDAMRCEYPSETVGMLVMDYDAVLEDGVEDDETFTAGLPRYRVWGGTEMARCSEDERKRATNDESTDQSP